MKVKSHSTISTLIKMYRNLCLVAVCLLATVSCIYCATPVTFVKNDLSYESLIGNFNNEPAPAGYFEIIEKVAQQYVANNGSNYEDFKKFGYGLDQFFLFKVLEKVYDDELAKPAPQTPDSNLDAIPVSDYVDESTGYAFKELVVYNFPAFKKGVKSELKHQSLSSASEYQVNVDYNADNTIVTGSFYVDGSKYFFVYTLKSSSYAINMRKRRNSIDDSDKFVFIKRSVGFGGEDSINTYDSSYVNSSVVNSQFKDILTNKVVPHVLSELSQRDIETLKRQVLVEDFKFIKKYKGLILTALTESAVKYIKAYVQYNKNGDDTFSSSNISFQVASPGARLPFTQTYYNIKLKGFLNFANPLRSVYENTTFSDNGRLFNLSQGIEFSYPEEGDKVAVFSYIFNDGRHDYPKEYKVKSITIISEYLSELSKKPYQVYRNKEVFFNGAGILVRFEIHGIRVEDQADSFVYKHLGNDIARIVQEYIESSST
ncbi:uncharacterized protein LOC135849111 [Planococcus citri]|uniref:uncharacterized protein LOC135849111 n=1 Tax=Planococcus citri TaxID=170843 RepID=UPI0031F76687